MPGVGHYNLLRGDMPGVERSLEEVEPSFPKIRAFSCASASLADSGLLVVPEGRWNQS